MNRQTRDVLVNGFALFAMFLGAGNLIFPPYLGFYSGTNWLSAMAGFLITGAGLPLMGIFATLKSGGSVFTLGRHVGEKFTTGMGVVIILTIGPFFAIPRTAATVHEVALLPLFPQTPSWLTATVFFAVSFFFVCNESKVLDRIGKFLTPFLLLTLATIATTAIFSPAHLPVAWERPFTFRSSFIEGYQTMDAIGSIMLAGVVLARIVARGYTSRAQQLSLTLKCGLLSGLLLALVYGSLLYAGATASSAHEGLRRADLLVAITTDLLGHTGFLCLSVAVTLACLTTAIGLTVTCGEYFQCISKGRLPYLPTVIVVTAMSWFISIRGVDFIIKLAVPVLVTIYPIVMTLILFNCFDQYIVNKKAYLGGVIGASLVALFDGLTTLQSQFSLNWTWIERIHTLKAMLPLQTLSLEWLLPAVAGAVVMGLLCCDAQSASQEEVVPSEA